MNSSGELDAKLFLGVGWQYCFYQWSQCKSDKTPVAAWGWLQKHSLTHSLPALQHWKASSHNLLQEKIRPFCIVSSLHSLYRVILCFITQPHLDSGVREMAWHRKLKVIMVCRDSSSDSLYYYHLLELFQMYGLFCGTKRPKSSFFSFGN